MFEDHAETCTNEVQCLKTMQRLALTGLASTFNSKILSNLLGFQVLLLTKTIYCVNDQ